jgi:hypothetical protein
MKKIIFIFICTTFFSCEITNIDYLKPIITTDEPTNILTNSAILGGKVLGEGGKDITEYGVVWSETFPPTIEDNKSAEGERIGWFSNSYESLKAGTTYYYAAYGINEVGVGYGEVHEFTTSQEASCTPSENYFLADTTLDMANGNYSSTDVVVGDTYLGGDYYMKAQKGFIGDYIEVQVHFDGSFEDLLPGAYPVISDLDFAFQEPNKSAVLLRYSGSNFISFDGGTVFIEREGNIVTVILCELLVNGSIHFNPYEAIITTKYQVSE